MELGIGTSWLREEWEAVALDFDRRGARVDEVIEVCRRLWNEDVVEHHGEFFDFGSVAFEPKPVQNGGVPLQIGGDGLAAFRRVATVGAGWMPVNHQLDEIPGALNRIAEIAKKLGRTSPIEVTMMGETNGRQDLDRYAAAGVTRLIVRPWSRSSEALEGLRQFAERIGPWAPRSS
ncbi:MAG: LLM class flavin-dependent oxidoreductase, partial [Acidimicrobiales bacterium]